MDIQPVTDFQRTIVLVYDKGTGDIVHVHEVLTERGGEHPGPEAVERAALELAKDGPRRIPIEPERMAVMALDEPLDPDPDYCYYVDPKRRALVQEPLRHLRRLS